MWGNPRQKAINPSSSWQGFLFQKFLLTAPAAGCRITVMNTILTGILVANIALFAVVLVAFIKFRSVLLSFLSFVSPPASDEPSPVSIIVGHIIERAGDSLIAKIKASLMGMRSGDVRAEQAAMAELSKEALAEASPVGAALLTQFPKLGKVLGKNPALLEYALSKILPKLAHTTAAAPGDSNGGSRDYAGRLNKYS